MVVGHDAIIERLHAEQPRSALFIGPRSVGKWTTAEVMRRTFGIEEADLLRVNRLTADTARGIRRFLSTASSSPSGKLVIARITDATAGSQHMLLKTCEEHQARVILISETIPLATVSSRCGVYAFARLTIEQVAEVLQRKGHKPAEATRLAQVSRGQVQEALDALETLDLKPVVLQVSRAFQERSEAVLEAVANRWSDRHTALLSTLCVEAISGRWRLFADAEVGMTRGQALRILTALRADVRPKLVIRSSLLSLLKGEK